MPNLINIPLFTDELMPIVCFRQDAVEKGLEEPSEE
jgi:hypothetical protein